MEGSYRYRPAAYFALAYVATWIPWLIGAYLARQEGGEAYGFLFNLIGLLLGPTGVALFFVFSSGSSARSGATSSTGSSTSAASGRSTRLSRFSCPSSSSSSPSGSRRGSAKRRISSRSPAAPASSP